MAGGAKQKRAGEEQPPDGKGADSIAFISYFIVPTFTVSLAQSRDVVRNMKTPALNAVALACISFLVGCGTIQNHDQLAQPVGRDLETYVGGTVFKLSRSRDLPNAFGRADVFGGKVFAGYTELRYQGLADDGRVVLRVTEVETQSNETTMSRYGQTTGNYQGFSDNRGNVSGNVTLNHAPKGSTEMLPPNTTQFYFDRSKENDLSIAGIRVSFIEATPQKLKYKLAR